MSRSPNNPSFEADFLLTWRSVLSHSSRPSLSPSTMASPTSATDNANPPNPSIAQSNTAASPPLSASTSSLDSERGRPTRLVRPNLTSPEPSLVIPRDHPEVEIQEEEFPPDDARSMSPRRNSADVERLIQEARQALKEYATEQPLRALPTRYYS